jgi:hypothetical protein
MAKKPYDPLNNLPSAACLRERLEVVEIEYQRLKVLLKLVEGIEEAEKPPETPPPAPESA